MSLPSVQIVVVTAAIAEVVTVHFLDFMVKISVMRLEILSFTWDWSPFSTLCYLTHCGQIMEVQGNPLARMRWCRRLLTFSYHRMFLLLPGITSLGVLFTLGLRMKWLLCRPVTKPTNNLSNWISMDALDTEHGRVALYSIALYAAVLIFDCFVSFTCCCCIEEVEDDDAPPSKPKQE